jgi:hypothetical protein
MTTESIGLHDVIVSVDGQSTSSDNAHGGPSASCTCQYPFYVFRNGSGHSEDCQVHTAYLKEHGIQSDEHKWWHDTHIMSDKFR